MSFPGGAAPVRRGRVGQVVVELALIAHALLPGNVGRVMVAEADLPVLLRQPCDATAPQLTVDQGHTLLASTENIGSGIGRIVEHTEDQAMSWRHPAKLAGSEITHRHLESLIGEVAHDSISTAVEAKSLEDKADDTLDLLVGIQAKTVRRLLPRIAGRRRTEELTAACLVQLSALKTPPHPGLLGLAHRALETEQESIVVVAGRVDGLLVHEEHVRKSPEFEQAVPIGGRAREARDLERENGANAPLRNVFCKSFEAGPPLRAGPALTKILIDQLDAVTRPAHVNRALLHGVLAGRGFRMLVELPEHRLAQVDNRSTLQMARLDLVVHGPPLRPLVRREEL